MLIKPGKNFQCGKFSWSPMCQVCHTSYTVDSHHIDAFTIEVWWNFDKMQIIFKAITGSSGYAFWWERTALHSMHGDGCLTLAWKVSVPATYLLRYAKVPYVTYQRELPKAATTSMVFCNRFFSHWYSVALSFPPRGVTRTSCYCFEYNFHLIKIPSHLNREAKPLYHIQV